MYLHHIQFGVVPAKFDIWAAHAHNNLSVMARMQGLVLMRILRDRDDPNRFFSIRLWRNKEDSDRALATPEVHLVTKTNPELGLSEGFPTVYKEYRLLDIVFGREGVEGYTSAEGFTNHIEVHVPPQKQSLWHPYRRNCASVWARQPGLLSYEVAADLNDPDLFLVMRTFRDHESSLRGPEGEPNEEIKLSVKPARDLNLYEGARGSVYAACDLFDAVYGPGGPDALRQFMANLQPV